MESIYYAIKVLAAIWLCMILFIFGIGAGKSANADRFSVFFLVGTMSSVMPIIEYGISLGRTGVGVISWGYPILSYLGLLLFIPAVAIHWAGVLTLKKQWSHVVAVSENHELVDTGIYKFIRHPAYAGMLLELLSFGLALANWVAILLLLIPNMIALAYRIYVEEKALEKYLGDAYIDYERRTKRLVPGIF